MANWYFLTLAALLVSVALSNHFETVGWFLITAGIGVPGFAIFAPHPRKAAVLDVAVTLAMTLGLLA